MPTAIILAGPNGAGKTTFANAFFRSTEERFEFLNADEIARDLNDHLSAAERDLRAGRLMLAKLDEVVANGLSFLLETTLSSRAYARRIAGWRAHGYRVGLIYIRLPSAEASRLRVALRAGRGGHGVPDEDVLRRFGRSASNLELVYKPLVDDWQVWESGESGFTCVDRSAA